MLRRFEALTDHDIRNASTIRVFVEDEEITEELVRVPSAADEAEIEAEKAIHPIKPVLCVVVKTRADKNKLEARVQKVLGEFIE